MSKDGDGKERGRVIGRMVVGDSATTKHLEERMFRADSATTKHFESALTKGTAKPIARQLTTQHLDRAISQSTATPPTGAAPPSKTPSDAKK